MIVPCIDLQGGKAVQLVRGRRRRLAVEDVLGLLERFRRYPLLHVIDLDAALGRGRNTRWVRTLCRKAQAWVRVGGGIRSVTRAEQILRWGAEKVIIGSAAFHRGRIDHRFLRRLAVRVGRRRIILALDAERGHIVVRGWRKKLRLRPEEVMPELGKYCSEFLCTYVDAEGAMRGTNLAWFRKLRRATPLPITAAGGIRSRREVRALERIGMKAAVGMALYLGKLS
jgi:phosphoribosylformimino-5-aminoimidazole carboxamide ribotide isomerase